MRNEFAYHLPLTQEREDEIWKNGLVSFDANVLLDLYRLHDKDAKQLLESIQRYEDRLWLTHQVGLEFFRNREAVLREYADSQKKVRKRLKGVATKARETTTKLAKDRAVPEDIMNSLGKDIAELVEKAREKLDETWKQEQRPSLQDDPILEVLFKLFSGCTGAAPTESEIAAAEADARTRAKRNLPPGANDHKKTSGDPAGDLKIWKELLKVAQSQTRDVIFVTNDLEAGWWENRNSASPRLNWLLLEDAHRETDRTVLVVPRDQFLKRSVVSPVAFENLQRALSAFAQRRKPKPTLAEAISEAVVMAAQDLADNLVVDDPAIADAMALTNATDFELSSLYVDVGDLDASNMSVEFNAEIEYSGEIDENKMYVGHELIVDLRGVARFDGDEWVVESYDIVRTKVTDSP